MIFTAFLTPDRIRKEYFITVKEKIIPDGSPIKPNRKLTGGTGEVRYITVHNTDDINEAEGTTDAEQYVRATYNGNMGGVTVHYYIDSSDCWQMLYEDEIGYHSADGASGPGNSTSLAIEIIMKGDGSESDKEAEDRGAALAAALLKKHGLKIDKLTTHNRWYPPKYCPAYILPHWDEFEKRVEYYMSLMDKPPENQVWRVQTGAFGSRETAQAYAESVRQAGFPAFVVLSGDIDGDGKITAADARTILRKSVGAED